MRCAMRSIRSCGIGKGPGAFEAPLSGAPLTPIDGRDKDTKPGKQGEKAYDLVRSASNLFFRVADGRQGSAEPLMARSYEALPSGRWC
jgi:hypothetical protein